MKNCNLSKDFFNDLNQQIYECGSCGNHVCKQCALMWNGICPNCFSTLYRIS